MRVTTVYARRKKLPSTGKHGKMCRCGSMHSEFVLTTTVVRTNQRMTHTIHSGVLGNIIGNELAVVTIRTTIITSR